MKKIELVLSKDIDGFHVVTGHMRLKVALSLSDEIKVEVPNIGEVLITKLADGSLIASQGNQKLALLGM